ncbi:MAG: hypothetical protein HY587_03900 [Candidatus Omnitrophica bacterium]|nr:hypothetical protein [Candidatus Omnitrophota bacterium]
MFWIQMALAIFSVILGSWLFFFPRQAIDFQIAFYHCINWIMQPVSMEREIRNTKCMGGGTLILGISGILYLLLAVK